MTGTIKLTAKRQATFPKELCEELDLKPGDAIQLDKRIIDGKAHYCIRPVKNEAAPAWFGVFNSAAKGKSHRISDIRESIAKGRTRELQQNRKTRS